MGVLGFQDASEDVELWILHGVGTVGFRVQGDPADTVRRTRLRSKSV